MGITGLLMSAISSSRTCVRSALRERGEALLKPLKCCVRRDMRAGADKCDAPNHVRM